MMVSDTMKHQKLNHFMEAIAIFAINKYTTEIDQGYKERLTAMCSLINWQNNVLARIISKKMMIAKYIEKRKPDFRATKT